MARLLPTTAALTLRGENPPIVLDGPFAKTEKQLLGFQMVDCKNLEDALELACVLDAANPGGIYEIRPVGIVLAGVLDQALPETQ